MDQIDTQHLLGEEEEEEEGPISLLLSSSSGGMRWRRQWLR